MLKEISLVYTLNLCKVDRILWLVVVVKRHYAVCFVLLIGKTTNTIIQSSSLLIQHIFFKWYKCLSLISLSLKGNLSIHFFTALKINIPIENLTSPIELDNDNVTEFREKFDIIYKNASSFYMPYRKWNQKVKNYMIE